MIFRATYPTSSEAQEAATDFVSVRWQIGKLGHLARVDSSLTMTETFSEPFGSDAMSILLRTADRCDRSERGLGLGDFTDVEAWDMINAGNVGGLVRRLPATPFGLAANAGG